MYIFQSDALPVIFVLDSRVVALKKRQDPLHCRPVHTSPVVHNRNLKEIPVHGRLNHDTALALFGLNAVYIGVLHNRLQNQLGHQDSRRLWRFHAKLHLPVYPAVQKIHVFAHDSDLLFQWNHILHGADQIMNLLRKSLNHLRHLLPALLIQGAHADNLQSVIKEVGINLGFQRRQLRLILLDLSHIGLIDVGFQGAAHLIEPPGEYADLVP